jgi:hypothetical protein
MAIYITYGAYFFPMNDKEMHFPLISGDAVSNKNTQI